MPKFSMDINGVESGAAAGREQWSGELPPTGNYEGVLSKLTVDVIGANSEKNAGKPKLQVGVELRNTEGGKYDGYLAWGSLNLIDSSIPYVNQFLQALTDGSDAQFEQIKKAFYGGFSVDERKKHVTAIGKWKVNSPEGELPIRVAIKNKPFFNEKTKTSTDSVRIESYLLGSGVAPSSGGVEEAPEEEDAVVVSEDEDESILD